MKMSKYIEQLNIRVPPELKNELQEVAEFEHTKVTDLVRQLIRERIREVTSTRAYQNWKRRREEKLGGRVEEHG